MPFEAMRNSSQELSQDRQPRYLRANFGATGLGHQLTLVKGLLTVAHRLNRIAVVPNFKLLPLHNARANADGNPQLYINLDRSTISENGKRQPVRYVWGANFDKNQFAPSQTLRLTNEKRVDISASDTARYALIIFNLTMAGRLFVDGQAKRDLGISVSLAPSDTVLGTAQQVIQDMLRAGGKSLRPLSESPRYFDYCGVKIRRTDRINHPNARIQASRHALTSVGNIKANLSRRGFVRPSTVIYLLSDEPDLRYFDGIRKSYAHYFTACDFPALNSLRPPPRKNE